ncbi:MAG: clostripain-related cysteine peptidase, partial [Lachnospiraceae bacterium]
MADHPQGREKHVSGQGLGVHRRGAAGTGSVGSGGRPGTSSGGGGGINMGGGSGRRPGSSGGGNTGGTRGGGGLSFITIIIILAVAIFGGGGSIGLLSGFLGGDSSSGTTYSQNTNTGNTSQTTTNTGSPSSALSESSGIFSLLGGSSAGTSTGWGSGNNTGASVDTQVAKAARKKFTTPRGNGKDVVTILVYLCGTDLESKHGMASRDLQEMAAADLSDNINLIVYTGGCKKWKTDGISNNVNQIYKVTKGQMTVLERDMGSAAMTLPSTLSSFIKYGKKNYPANRTMLIFWDHGGGSLSGYGYDEK